MPSEAEVSVSLLWSFLCTLWPNFFETLVTLNALINQAFPWLPSLIQGVVVAWVVKKLWKHVIGRRIPRISVPAPKEIDPSWKGPVLQNPSLRDPAFPNRIICYDAATSEEFECRSFPAMSGDQVREAVRKARVAQEQWAQTTYEQRREVLHALMKFVVDNQETICRVASRETGKTMVDGSFGEVLTTCEKLRWTIAEGEAVLAPEYRSVGMIMAHKSARVQYQPLGVLGAIIPWNYPFHNMFGQIISAIFAGNGLVIKVSEYACWSSSYYESIIKTTLAQLGHNPDLVQIVTGFGDTGAALVNSGVDKITFIGSPEVGKLVMKAASDTLTPVVLELGGKDAAIVFDDCDFDQVVNLAMRGTYQNCGQNCIGLERLLVQETLYDKLVGVLDAKVGKLSQGAPLCGNVDCGAMTMGPIQCNKIQKLVEDSVKAGARLLHGGVVSDTNGRRFYPPTMLVDVTENMPIAKSEVFGPVMVVMKFKDEADALRIANSCEYGLGSSVFTLNKLRGERVANKIMAGMCNINDYGVNYLCQSLPFGGVKVSGFDRFAGVEGLRGCCLVKSITSDRLPFIRTNIPPPLQYPLTASGFGFCEALISMFYSNGLWPKVRAIFTLTRIALTEKKK